MHQSRLGNLDVLRALAALAVCLYHFREDIAIRSIDVAASAFAYGYLGVDVFFVISGFVIPLMLIKTKYSPADMGAFLASRFVRLYPAYIASIMLVFALWYLSSCIPGFSGQSPAISIASAVSNSLLICDFSGEEWILPVFWTLAIEAQYYALIAISFAFLTAESKGIRYAVLAAWIAAPLVAGVGPTVFTWTALFAMGILCCLRGHQLIGRLDFWILFGAAFSTHALTRGTTSAVVGSLTGLAILYLPEVRSPVLAWIGTISYSIYLIHGPLWVKVMNLTKRLPDIPAIQVLALVVGALVVIAASYLFFMVIERPSHAFSRIVRIRQSRAEP